eukprot:TRINITY_DN1587_c0_g1_i1.p1 TRINITY_DN1587_c0_g1~~TRINITY_DN1587_c0_g1_i1.p1  ORF type:complete len:136 (-),score=36.43 TRINITY_DN1587_c0_g1_i1:32-439(-)
MTAMGIDDPFMQDLVFRSYDSDGSDSINFSDFASSLSVQTRGDSDEKLRMAFNMFDLDNDDYITRDELAQFVEGLFNLIGPITTFTGRRYVSAESFIDYIYDEMETDEDGRISFENYRETASRNPDILQGLKLYN